VSSWFLILAVLALVSLSNGAPVLARLVLGDRLRQPVDGGHRLGDRRRALGASKTVIGLAAALLVTMAGGLLLGFDWWIGLLIGVAAMAGDLASSFVKRRLGRPPNAKVPLLDELPEAVLPVLAVAVPLGLDWLDGLLIVAAFVLIHAVLDRPLRWIRRRLGAAR